MPIFPLISLSHKTLVNTASYLDAPTLDGLATVSKAITPVVSQVRQKIVAELARKPGRLVKELLPTYQELSAMGATRPCIKAVFHALQTDLTVPTRSSRLLANMKAHADLQKANDSVRQYGGLPKRPNQFGGFDISQVNNAGRTHGFGIRNCQRNNVPAIHTSEFIDGQEQGARLFFA